jgi:hypothetical protein
MNDTIISGLKGEAKLKLREFGYYSYVDIADKGSLIVCCLPGMSINNFTR